MAKLIPWFKQNCVSNGINLAYFFITEAPSCIEATMSFSMFKFIASSFLVTVEITFVASHFPTPIAASAYCMQLSPLCYQLIAKPSLAAHLARSIARVSRMTKLVRVFCLFDFDEDVDGETLLFVISPSCFAR